MQAEQNQRAWPSGTPRWLGTRRTCLTFGVDFGRATFVVLACGSGGASVASPTSSPPATLQKRQPLQATPPMTFEPAAEGLVWLVPSPRR